MTILRQLKEVAEIGQRLRGDPGDSFVRVSELVKLGIVRMVNGTLQLAASNVTSSPTSNSRLINTLFSLQGGGNLTTDLTLSLVGDVATPGASKLYGTDSGGTRAWVPTPDFVRGATWVASTGAIVVPTNNVVVQIPRACTIKEITILTVGGPGSCTVDIKRSTFAGYPPVISLAGGVPPAISAGITYSNVVLTGWTTTLALDDVLLFNLSACSTFTLVAISVRMG